MKVYIIVVMLICMMTLSADIWIETTQQDFRDCSYECNLYASQRNGGAVEFTTRWDLNGDGYLDIVVANEMASTSHVYWGSATGYDSLNCTPYPVTNGGNCESGDLDGDGYPDLVFSSCTGNCILIFWGTVNGPDPGNYTSLPLYSWNETCYVADFDKDGYLDIAVGHYDGANGAIFWGSATGFAAGNVTLLPGGGRHNFEVADFDKNGWLDIIFVQQLYDHSVIYWGDAAGYNSNNTISLQNPGSHTHGCSVADLDKNGYLDIVLTCFGGDAMYIYTGKPGGFSLWAVLYPGPCYGGTTIADFNKDGHLDIVCARGYGVQQKPVIYWGGSLGFTESNKTPIGIPVDASGILAADYNDDGHFDVLIHNYAYPPEPSYILMGPDYLPKYELPSQRDHHSRFREIGNVYDRGYYEDYYSSVFDAGAIADWGTIEWDEILPNGTAISFWVLTGDSPNLDASLLGWQPIADGGSIPDANNARYLQYKARLYYTNPCCLPCLEEVRVSYTLPDEAPVELVASCIPNPVRKRATIRFPCSDISNLSVEMYRVDGALIRNFDGVAQNDGVGQVIWDRTDNNGRIVPSGVYFLKVVGDLSIQHKVVVLD